jgi:hypothetical protein
METREQKEEADRLFAEWKRAVNYSYEMRIRRGDDSEEYATAEKVAGDLWCQYKKVRPNDPKHWLERQ